jgi:hypothetical protein
VRWREVELEARVPCPPLLDLFPGMDTPMVAYPVDRGDAGENLPVEVFQERDELFLAFAALTLTVYPTSAGIKGCEQREGTVTLGFVFHPIGHVVWLGRLGRMHVRAWW